MYSYFILPLTLQALIWTEVFLSAATEVDHQQHFLPEPHQHHWAAGQMKTARPARKDQEIPARIRDLHCRRITNAPSATLCWPTRRSLHPTSEDTTRSNLHQIPTIPRARPRCTTAASAERCSLHSALWTDTCWSTPVSVHSLVFSVDKPSLPTETCTGTRGPTVPEILNW